MKSRLRLIVLFVLVINGSVAKAEFANPALESGFSGIIELIENLAFSGGAMAGIPMGACIPSIKPVSLNSIDIRFTSSLTCPINGTVRLGILPITASIHLEFVNVPMIQSVDADFTATIRPGSGGLTTQWSLLNGHIAYRLLPSMPLNDWYLTGAGIRQRVLGSGLTINSRFNTFNPGTGAGYTFNRNIKRKLFAGTQKQNSTCTLTGAIPSDPMSGTLSNCH